MMKIIWICLLFLPFLCHGAAFQGVTLTGCAVNAGGAASCATPTGDELTDSFGDGSTSCWTSGPSSCDGTWTISTGTFSIDDTPAGAPSNTACAKSLKIDSTSAVLSMYRDIPIANNVAVTYTFSFFGNDISAPAYGSVRLISYTATANPADSNRYTAVFVARPGAGTTQYIRVYGATDYCDLAFNNDAWNNLVITLPASDAGEQSTAANNGGAACTFTRGTASSRYFHVGASITGAAVLWMGNVKIDTP